MAYELLHLLRTKKKGKRVYMSIKLDMNKAYDCVEWNYLEKVMWVMGFKSRFIGLIMSCISSASFSVIVNSAPKGHIIPSRGLDKETHYLLIFSSYAPKL